MTPSDAMKGIDTTHVRRYNSKAVLEALRAGGPMGRRELAKLTNLSVPTICRVVDDLIEQRVITEVASVNLRGAGRKTALLDINSSGGWVVAMDIGGSRIRAAAVDLAGRIYESLEYPQENIRGEESVTPAILSALNDIIAKCGKKRGMPRAVGISCSGIVDSAAGIVKLSFNLELRDYPLAKIVADACHLPTSVRNDVVASTLGEAKFGPGQTCSNFAYVTVGTGVGAGLVIGGNVQELPSDAEFGLMVVSPHGDPERFGGRGYLESLATGRGIAAAARRELESGAQSRIRDMVNGDISAVTAKHVAEAACEGDDLAKLILARAAEYLGLAITNLAHTLGLTLFVISGGVSMAGDAFWKPLVDSVSNHEFWPGRIRLEPSALQKDAALLGVGMLAIDEAIAAAS